LKKRERQRAGEGGKRKRTLRIDGEREGRPALSCSTSGSSGRRGSVWPALLSKKEKGEMLGRRREPRLTKAHRAEKKKKETPRVGKKLRIEKKHKKNRRVAGGRGVHKVGQNKRDAEGGNGPRYSPNLHIGKEKGKLSLTTRKGR